MRRFLHAEQLQIFNVHLNLYFFEYQQNLIKVQEKHTRNNNNNKKNNRNGRWILTTLPIKSQQMINEDECYLFSFSHRAVKTEATRISSFLQVSSKCRNPFSYEFFFYSILKPYHWELSFYSKGYISAKTIQFQYTQSLTVSDSFQTIVQNQWENNTCVYIISF